MSAYAWVIGASGLLGSALVRALRQDRFHLHQPANPFSWSVPETVENQLRQESLAFAEQAVKFDRWAIFWAAGVGSMASDPAVLDAEARAISSLLGGLGKQTGLQGIGGAFILASSAGALYGGHRAACYSESSLVSPMTAYAAHKLRQEKLVQDFVAQTASTTGLIVRYSTLYGVGQSRTKPQGLITQLARRIIANEPAHVYVPFDTIRDYLHADDAARLTLSTLRDVRDRRSQSIIKIVASERPTSIAQLIGIFRRVSDRKPRIITSTNDMSSRYVHCAQFRSEQPAGKPHAPCRPLVLGIHQVLEAERAMTTHSP